MILVRDASLVYKDRGTEIYACRNLNLHIRDKEFIGILGPSGSGKSSLLYLLSGLKDPTLGEVLFRGIPYREYRETERARIRLKEFGFLFQLPYLIGYLTALENVVLVNPSLPNARTHAEHLLEQLCLKEKMHRLPNELSVGERQRVCVARALYSSPDVIFADEPTASLDSITARQVMQILAKKRQGTLIVATHDSGILSSADRVFRMQDGRLIEN
ncbi:MAG TPA: ATP-binding cassette domain-containing protein [Fimbriimonadales bacterium]|nr:ATP-binding cassette domain-containing protein [Fimbriimonadales bacterium]